MVGHSPAFQGRRKETVSNKAKWLPSLGLVRFLAGLQSLFGGFSFQTAITLNVIFFSDGTLESLCILTFEVLIAVHRAGVVTLWYLPLLVLC